MINCFTFTYKTLSRKGLVFPTEFEGYSTSDLKTIIVDYKNIIDNKIHYAYFDSFCTKVKKAQENDIVVTKKGIGIAVNNFKYVTISEESGNKTLETIKRGCTIYRVGLDG